MSLGAVLDGLEHLPSIRAGPLRALADSATDVVEFLDVVAENAVALEVVPDLVEALADLEEHRDTLTRMNDLAGLADDVERLGRVLRGVRGQRDDLEWAVEQTGQQ